VEILEAGRARELRRRIAIPSLDELDGVPQGLRAQYAAAAEELLTAPIGKDGSVAARRFQEVLTSVRAQAGRPEFAAVVRAEEVAQAIEPGWPLVYLNPSPHGTLILLVTRGVDDRAMVEATFLDITGMQVMLRLLAGDAADLDDPTQAHNIASYLGGISGTRTVEKDFKKDLDETLPWFGEHLARPIRDLLVSEEPKGVTLIPCGPVAVLPLHACSWVEHHERHCLVDDFEVRYAPSAIVHRAARERATAAESTTPFLVALGNPKGDLAAAGPEVEEIAAQFGTGNSRYAIGSAADPEVLRAHASQATHLHFACHARGGVFDASETAIELASGWLPATAFPAFGGISTRLVVVSACQSALPEIAKLPDEAFSIGTVMLAAGSACVIASLWEVDDLSTSLLMTRLYEEMLGAGQQPPAALRRAQLWLRDLTEQAEHAYLHLHPSLNHEYRRRRLRGDAPGKRGSAAPNGAEIRPYSHPDYWAPFIAVGV
jgi:CHAT domain-containing protein